MKQIEPIQIWDKGQVKTAEYLQGTGVNVVLDTNASFYWGLFTKVVDAEGNEVAGEQVAQGNLPMTDEEYQLWNTDDVAWDFIAGKLNLTIIA